MSTFRLQRLDHISLNVSDRRRSIEWYRDVLGLEQMNSPGSDDSPVFLGEFGTCVALFQAQGPPPGPREPESVGLRHFALMLGRKDLELAQSHLGELGVEYRFQDHGSSHSLYFGDPDGHRIELTTYEV